MAAKQLAEALGVIARALLDPQPHHIAAGIEAVDELHGELLEGLAEHCLGCAISAGEASAERHAAHLELLEIELSRAAEEAQGEPEPEHTGEALH
jgi:hypothetical protein